MTYHSRYVILIAVIPRVECDSISHLLQAQMLMCEGEFLTSLLQLHQAHSKLTSWGSSAQAKEV